MNWLTIEITSSKEYADEISDALSMAGAKAVTFVDAKDEQLLEPAPAQTPLWESVQVIGLFTEDTKPKHIMTVLHMLVDGELLRHYRTDYIEDKDWLAISQQNFNPIMFNQLCICPSWCQPPSNATTVVYLDPGLAFGTGTHATTSLCLTWLSQQNLQDRVVIDYGCGSGILTLAALAMGAKHVYAFDHDPQAILACEQNATLNQQQNRITVLKQPLSDQVPADIVIANIVLQPLLDLRDDFYHLLKPQGQLILSGLLQEQVTHLQQHYAQQFIFDSQQELDTWMLLTATKQQH